MSTVGGCVFCVFAYLRICVFAYLRICVFCARVCVHVCALRRRIELLFYPRARICMRCQSGVCGSVTAPLGAISRHGRDAVPQGRGFAGTTASAGQQSLRERLPHQADHGCLAGRPQRHGALQTVIVRFACALGSGCSGKDLQRPDDPVPVLFCNCDGQRDRIFLRPPTQPTTSICILQ